METPVVFAVASPFGRQAHVAFFDRDLPVDPLSWLIDGPPLALRRYPFLASAPAMELSEEGVFLRQRLFLEAPLQLFRYLRFDLRPSDVQAPYGVEVKEWPHKGEPLLAMKSEGQAITACSLDGLCLDLRVDFLSETPVDPSAWPTLDRWHSTSYGAEKDRAEGIVSRTTIEALARRGNKTATEYLKVIETYEACFNAAWRKIDPEADAVRFVLVSGSGTTRGLDQVVDQRVRATCKATDFEKKQQQLSKKLRDGGATDFKATVKLLQDRLASPQAPPVAAPLPPAGLGIVLGADKNEWVVKEVLPGSTSGLEPGDVVVAVGGEALGGLTLSEVVVRLRGDAGSEVELSILRRRRPMTLRAARTVIPPK